MSDFYKMSAMMKDLFPSNPEADKKALQAMAGQPQESTAPTKNYVKESADVTEGSLSMDKDYSINDFAKLAGIQLNETQKEGPAGQLKGKDAIAKQPAMTTNNPTQDKLVGEEDDPFIKSVDDTFGQGTVAKTIGFSPRGELTKLIYRAIKAVMPEADEAEVKKAANAAADSMQESIKERELTKPEENERERIVKGMKKAKGDFKDRYGDDAEAVMYATATKNAKKNAESSIKEQLLKALNDLK